MIKKIKVDQLKVGMFVKDLDCGWLDHPFLIGSFKIKSEEELKKVQGSNIKIAYIDSEKGVDIDPPKTKKPTVQIVANKKPHKSRVTPEKHEKKVDAASEALKAKAIYKEATGVVRTMMEDVRLGQQMDVARVDPVAERMIQSVFRNQYAFNGISRIKTKDDYTFMHCVSVAGLMVTFAKTLGLDEETMHQVAVGGLVHDVGKIMVPDKVLNKPGKLTDDEFVVMKDHVTHSREILADNEGISDIARDVALLHHERVDGTGYPLGLKGDEISLIGKMAAIVDVYDALTSIRVYKSAWDPAMALKKMLEWSSTHFDRALVEKFIRCLGIYPLGSLVELESGKLGIVTDQGAEMLKPKIRVIYNVKKRCYVRVTDMDLAKEAHDRIVSTVMPTKYNIDMNAFL